LVKLVVKIAKNKIPGETIWTYICLWVITNIHDINFRQNGHFGPWTISWGSVSSHNFQNGYFSPQTLLLSSISSQNYKDDRFSPQTLHFGLNFIHKILKVYFGL
jgi:hypothetical protein